MSADDSVNVRVVVRAEKALNCREDGDRCRMNFSRTHRPLTTRPASRKRRKGSDDDDDDDENEAFLENLTLEAFPRSCDVDIPRDNTLPKIRSGC